MPIINIEISSLTENSHSKYYLQQEVYFLFPGRDQNTKFKIYYIYKFTIFTKYE